MATSTRIPLRGARDRLVDLLGIGETYPLQDVTVENEGLTVPVDATAKITVSPSQADVRYLLRGRDDRPVGQGPGRTGTGAALVLETPAIEEDVTFKVLARKVETEREAFLHGTATVKVGLDVTLVANILAPTLDPAVVTPTPADPRIVDYGSRVAVEVERSQEGVDYRLVRLGEGNEEEVLSESDVRGNLDSIVLSTLPVAEDVEIRVRATKTFDPSEGRESQTDLLLVVLQLRVRADPALLPSVDPSPVIDFGGDVAIKIENSQQTVSYRLYTRPLGDGDFIYGSEVAVAPVISIDVGNGAQARVPAPTLTDSGEVPAGYVAAGEARRGTGGELRLLLPAPADDSLMIVEARKEHEGVSDAPSVRWLGRAMVLLVRPNPAPELAMTVPVAGSSIQGPVHVAGGQPGVFYYFRRGAGGAERSLPAYFHKVDEDSPELNKGLGQLRMGVDFAVAADADGMAGNDPARVRPPDPTVELGRLPLGIDIHVRALKARSGVAVPLASAARLEGLPEIRLAEEAVAPGSTARIEVAASVVGERYQPFAGGREVRRALNGNGDTLVFVTEAIDAVTDFEVRVTRPGAPGIPVERRVILTVNVL